MCGHVIRSVTGKPPLVAERGRESWSSVGSAWKQWALCTNDFISSSVSCQHVEEEAVGCVVKEIQSRDCLCLFCPGLKRLQNPHGAQTRVSGKQKTQPTSIKVILICSCMGWDDI